jgi:hypothetical protein
MMEKQLVKIDSIKLGYNNDGQFGFTIELRGQSWGTVDFWGTWSEWSEYCKWSVDDQNKIFTESLLKMKKLLKDAKRDTLEKLNGAPIEATFEGCLLKSWRILTEVL